MELVFFHFWPCYLIYLNIFPMCEKNHTLSLTWREMVFKKLEKKQKMLHIFLNFLSIQDRKFFENPRFQQRDANWMIK